MKSLFFVLLIVVSVIAVSNVWRTRRPEPAVTTAAALFTPVPYNGPRVPVIIELFTSEGCSSCPPADALLAQLDQQQPVPGAEIIALSEHVDYWNYIGWADPFSSEAYSARQQGYAEALRLTGGRGDVYTPQMVVDGQFDLVGGNAVKAREVIAQAAAFPKAEVKLTLIDTTDKAALKLHVQTSRLPQLHANDQAEVMLAITENNLASSVTRGENSGRKLRHSAVTRELRTLGTFASAQKTFEADATVKLADTWKRAEVRLVAFVQERAHRRILGAASINLSGKLN